MYWSIRSAVYKQSCVRTYAVMDVHFTTVQYSTVQYTNEQGVLSRGEEG